MKVAIIGTQGLPARYGGFETLAENLVEHTSEGVFEFTVYCSARAYSKRIEHYKNAKLVYLPFSAQGVQSIFYDLVSILHSIRSHDKLLVLGVSGCFILPFLPARLRKKIIVNIDGLEHKRDKWNWFARKILLSLESLAVSFAGAVIADNKVIQEYIGTTYGKNSHLIEYGGDHASEVPAPKQGSYYFCVCRIEPENNIHLILHAFSLLPFNLVIVGNWDANKYSKELKIKYQGVANIQLLAPIYDLTKLNALRAACKWYIHGHSAGGTNPSLVEAMNLGLNILAYDVHFNRETTEELALYFKNSEDLVTRLRSIEDGQHKDNKQSMKEIAVRRYTWGVISEKYFRLFRS
jgi:glycosyltransferase involved in cell wall biosynthesis